MPSSLSSEDGCSEDGGDQSVWVLDNRYLRDVSEATTLEAGEQIAYTFCESYVLFLFFFWHWAIQKVSHGERPYLWTLHYQF